MEEKRNQFEEFTFDVITALNHLMQCNEVCRNDKAVIKINRFKKWVLELQDDQKEKQNEVNQ